jgi:hypothetical protein
MSGPAMAVPRVMVVVVLGSRSTFVSVDEPLLPT